MDWEAIWDLLPHWLAMFFLMGAVVIIRDLYFPEVSLWVILIIAILVGLSYPQAVRRLGVAPAAWEK